MHSPDPRLAAALRTAADAASARTFAPPARQIAARGRRRRRVRVGATLTVTACLAITVGVTLAPDRPPRPVGPADAPATVRTPTPSATLAPSPTRTPPYDAAISPPPSRPIASTTHPQP
ncbi:hypothetical protein [Kitasatospora griseola]|uniref:hypothetical protein n=1 Tax=Kitasatospora griseola TaxID=2064 RepID=UPI00365C918E